MYNGICKILIKKAWRIPNSNKKERKTLTSNVRDSLCKPIINIILLKDIN